MTELEAFLKFLAKTNYPSKKTEGVAHSLEYPMEEFVPDLYEELGQQKAKEFVDKTFRKILHNELFCYDMVEYPLGGNVCVRFNSWRYDDTEKSIAVSSSWGPSKVHTEEGDKTIQDIIDEADMGELPEVYDFLESLLDDIKKEIFLITGIKITFE